MSSTTEHLPTVELIYWPLATSLGLIISVALFLTIPRLDELPEPKPVKMIALDFFEWQPPPKPQSASPKPLPKLKPKPQTLVKPKPKPVAAPKPEPVLTEQEPPPNVEPQPLPAPEPAVVDLAPSPSTEEALPIPMPLAKLTAMPRFLHKEQPIYPAMRRVAGEEATVKLEVLIDKFGNVRDVQIKKSAGPEFDQAAIAAIRASSFSPGEIEHQAVTVLLTVPVKFKLR